MALVIISYPKVINLARIESEPVVNITIQAGIGKITNSIPNSGPCIPEWFTELEEKILHDPKPKTKCRLKDARKYESENVDTWDAQDERGWRQNQKLQRSDVFWDRKKDGIHIDPAQVWYTRNNDKRIIPSREILDDNCGKNKVRNDTIEKIRDKYLSRQKKGRGNYENLGNYYYKSQQDKELFLKEVEDLGLIKNTNRKKCTVEIKAFDDMSSVPFMTSKELADYSNQYDDWGPIE